MKTHDLKSWPEFFVPVLEGKKNFELRKDDRHFRSGDTLRLREWEPNTASYSGREVKKVVTFVLEGVGPGGITPLHGLSRGYVILAISDPESISA
jgi:hypothetical protein